jgi:transposase
MRVAYERCGGLDVHKETVVACLIVASATGKAVKEIRTYRTMTGELQAMASWLQEKGCTHVARESTGVYWKSVYNVLAGMFDLLVVNAEPIKQVSGRKTAVADAAWIADLLCHGLLRGSLMPSAQQRAWRDLTRYRTRLVEERTSEAGALGARLQKV